ncbi:hypothetical protein DFH07DRAFT_951150 [Mycena maculata]|uniref:Secreted protein n=1 Tax=Mycena maculata TaxID=230809 RepID=A0AAD7NW31_9AGAR|nr:hypothetical protein DFH07DRAFT_951150 [Mycena maculata]
MSFFGFPLRLRLFLHAIMVNPLNLIHRSNLTYTLRNSVSRTSSSPQRLLRRLLQEPVSSDFQVQDHHLSHLLKSPALARTNQQCMTVRVAVVQSGSWSTLG